MHSRLQSLSRTLQQLFRRAPVGVVRPVDGLPPDRVAPSGESARQFGLLSTIIESSPNLVFVRDLEGRFTLVNRATAVFYGLPASAIVGKTEAELNASPGAVRAFLENDRDIIRNKQSVSYQVEAARDGQGRERWIQATKIPLQGADGELTGILCVATDCTDFKLAQAQIEAIAYRDQLTGLINQQLFTTALSYAIAQAKRTSDRLAVFFLDLDRFKLVNDTLGHDAGSELLAQVGKRCAGQLRESDLLSRFGGDEFVGLLTGVRDRDQVLQALQRVARALSHPFALDGTEVHVTASIGIAMYPEDGSDGVNLIRASDSAMYQGKENGRNRIEFYGVPGRRRSANRLALEADLRVAVERNEFVLYFQAQTEIRTGLIVGAEVLTRWHHPLHGVIGPAEFIPIAEETGSIIQIGQWVMRAACEQNKALQAAGFPPIKVAVNVSGKQFENPDFVKSVGEALKRSRLAPQYLELEITESVAMKNPETSTAIMDELHEMGIQLAIDDFGTGYSSLANLKRFPLDALKIDRTFIQNCYRDPDDGAIVMAVISMAHSMGLKAIAEGVESERQLDYLRALQCDALQGYLAGRPEPIEQFRRTLSEREESGGEIPALP